MMQDLKFKRVWKLYYEKSARKNIFKTDKTHHAQPFQRMFAKHKIILSLLKPKP